MFLVPLLPLTLFSGHFPHSNLIITLLKIYVYNCEAFIKSANLNKMYSTEF